MGFQMIRAALLAGSIPSVLGAQAPMLTPATPRAAGMSGVPLDSVAALYRNAVADGKIVGAVVIIARHGKVVMHETFGLRDVQGRRPMERGTMFRMSSNTKPIIAAAVAILTEDGKLSFTDSVKRHLPAWDNRKSRTITVHQLLSHTSGIRIDALFAPRLVSWPWAGRPTLKSETDRIGRVGAADPPGTSYFYTNAGYNALGGLIETVSGRSLDTFLRDEIFVKLGMLDSYADEASANLAGKTGRMGPTYSRDEKAQLRVLWKPGDATDAPFARGSGGVVTTAWDYAVFVQMMLNGGAYGDVRLLRPETVRAMLTPHTPPGARPYGYGWGINPGGIFTHSGSTGTYAWGDPARGVVGVVLAQTTDASDLRARVIQLVNCAVDSHGSASAC
jgi:CubicO group peptidase (beta-lactamase class C family)